MDKIKKLHIAVYGFDLFYIVSSWKDCVKQFKENFEDDISDKCTGTGWATSLITDNYAAAYFIWIDDEVGFDVIAHEAFHAMKFILINYAGLTLSCDSDEAFAYLLAYICHQVINKKGEVCNGTQTPTGTETETETKPEQAE